MGPGYRLAPHRVDPSSRRRALVVALSCLALLAVVIAKPWAMAPASVPATAAPSPTAASAVVQAAPAIDPALAGGPATAFVRTWPVLAVQPRAGGLRPTASEQLASREVASQGWSVGDGGSGPRLLHDERWAEWQAASVAPATGDPEDIVVWPGSGVCNGLPLLDALPSFLAVSAPPRLGAVERLAAWWSDGARVVALANSVREIAAGPRSTVRFLERIDGTRWPAGRYEIHATVGAGTFAVTVCL